MAPVRRYLRITKWSVLEVRIYLDNPALAHTWLLNSRNPALPRVIQAVRPLVIPKLREEKERSKGKGKRAKGIKDTVSEDDFEVSIFLTDLSSPHSLLTKQKDFRGGKGRLRSNSGKLTGWLTGTNEEPVNVDGDDDEAPVVIRQESDDEEEMRLEDYPESTAPSRGRKRPRDQDNESIFVDEDVSDDEGFDAHDSRSLQQGTKDADEYEEGEDKKKPKLNTSYDGFSIYGRILCLVVKRKGSAGRAGRGAGDEGATTAEGGQQMLESWVSTQAAQEQGIIDDR